MGGSQEDEDGLQSNNLETSSLRPALSRLQTSLSADNMGSRFPRISRQNSTGPTETSSLLHSPNQVHRSYGESIRPSNRSRQISRKTSRSQSLGTQYPFAHPQSSAWGTSKLHSPMFTRSGLRTPKTPRRHMSIMESSSLIEERVWYDQFTSTDWVRDSIADGLRVLELRKRKDFAGKLLMIFDSAQGWILVALIGCLVAAVAYFVDVVEGSLFDLKRGYCTTKWYYNKGKCCYGSHKCSSWRNWSEILRPGESPNIWIDWAAFITGCMILAGLSCFLTLYTKTVIPSRIASTFDENLGAQPHTDDNTKENARDSPNSTPNNSLPAMTYYSAAGSGVAEVKVILSGFVLHGYLGLQTLIIKTCALILSVASGMSLGKEGPYVHIATCIGNVACRLFPKYNLNDGKRREVLSASAASGVAVAFGSPLGGVLFSLEEVSYYFPPKTLFRTFFCCIVAALSLKFLNPYGTNKIVLFEVRYITDWKSYELVCFALVGVMGGLMGALFIKASRIWATTFRRIPVIKSWPMLEVLLVALVTGLLSFWNRYANLAVAELLLELASPCSANNQTGLCPRSIEDIPSVIRYLCGAFLIKAFLTVVTFGMKLPAGIYVPSMVVGGIMGRIVGHTIQYIVLQFPGQCPNTGNLEHCVTPGVYALVAAGATMCGVTRLSVTLAVILFELTGSLDHVLPFSLGVLCAKWTADFVEPHSIYDLLIHMNSYPFMDNRSNPVFDTELEEITPRLRPQRIIDISISPHVRASDLRSKLTLLQNAGEIDGGLPIVRDKVLVGLIPAPDLEFALDQILGPEEETLCLMSNGVHDANNYASWWINQVEEESIRNSDNEEIEPIQNENQEPEHADLTPYIDPAPLALDVHSPMDLVYQCFVKLGLRYICVVEDGQYRGMVHKKVFVQYVRELDAHGH